MGHCPLFDLYRRQLMAILDLVASNHFILCPQAMPLGFPGVLAGKNPPGNAGDTGSIPGSGRSSGEGNGNLLQYSCLGNPMDRGAWWATVHGVAKELDTTEQLNNRPCHSFKSCALPPSCNQHANQQIEHSQQPRNGNPLRYSCLKNPMDGEAW